MDDNDKNLIYGVSHIDGVTSVVIQFGSDGGMLLDMVTTIGFDPAQDAQSSNRYLLAKAVSSVDNKSIRPWVVNASTGAVLATTS